MIEDDLKKLRLTAPADGVRDRILSASRSARRWQVIDRWIAGGAGAAALAFLLALTANGTPHPVLIEAEAEKIAAEIGAPELAGAFRRALIPPPPTPWRFIDELP